jgi:uncharacterized protein (DUF433 family)
LRHFTLTVCGAVSTWLAANLPLATCPVIVEEDQQGHGSRAGVILKSMAATVSTHIELDEQGVAWIGGANVKVIEVVLDKLAYGWSPEETHFQHPNLSLAQIHAALAYYYENQERLDAEIDRRRGEVEVQAAESANSALRQKLLALKRRR